MSNAIIPLPETNVSIRPATLADVPFIDALQKKHSKMVGFMPSAQLVGKINAGDVLIAIGVAGERVGYVIGTDRYFKRDDCGIIYQLNVVPGKQRSFVGAALLKAQFDRSAYGCRLYCCWCAQDIAANRFWEAMGFVPLAFRTGGQRIRMKAEGGRMKGNAPSDSSFIPQPSSLFRGRVHIFWQKKIRAGDTTTQYWFPSQTTGGAIREDRLVIPIPMGVHWSEEMPILLPQESLVIGHSSLVTGKGQRTRDKGRAAKPAVERRPVNMRGGLYFAPPASPPPVEGEKPEPTKKPKRKNNPKMVAAARELRDRWLEHAAAGDWVLESVGKYDVTRALPATISPAPLLPGLHAPLRALPPAA